MFRVNFETHVVQLLSNWSFFGVYHTLEISSVIVLECVYRNDKVGFSFHETECRCHSTVRIRCTIDLSAAILNAIRDCGSVFK